jgi:GntR family transcriptional regulator
MKEIATETIQTEIGKDIRLEALADAYATLTDMPDQKADKCCEAFVKTIERGYWRPGDFLPTEKEIAAILPVSLGTVQTALRRLAHGGIIDRTRGLGTKIASPSDPVDEPKHIRFLDDDGTSLLSLEVKLISIDETTSQGAWSNYLGAHTSYIRIVRYIDVNQEFTIYNECFLEVARFRPLLDIAPETFQMLHLRMMLHDRFNCPTLGFTQKVSFYTPPPAVASIIGSPTGAQALMYEVLSYSLRQKPLSYQQMIIPPNSRKLDISSSL